MADGGVGDRCFMKDACDQPCVVDCSHPIKSQVRAWGGWMFSGLI